jgi:hypothetical protein
MDGYLRPSRSAEKWNLQKEKLLLRFKDLTEKDLHFEAGRKHEMIERVSLKLGKPSEEMEAIFQTI